MKADRIDAVLLGMSVGLFVHYLIGVRAATVPETAVWAFIIVTPAATAYGRRFHKWGRGETDSFL